MRAGTNCRAQQNSGNRQRCLEVLLQLRPSPRVVALLPVSPAAGPVAPASSGHALPSSGHNGDSRNHFEAAATNAILRLFPPPRFSVFLFPISSAPAIFSPSAPPLPLLS